MNILSIIEIEFDPTLVGKFIIVLKLKELRISSNLAFLWQLAKCQVASPLAVFYLDITTTQNFNELKKGASLCFPY
jgi:hypothetical protein